MGCGRSGVVGQGDLEIALCQLVPGERRDSRWNRRIVKGDLGNQAMVRAGEVRLNLSPVDQIVGIVRG